MALHRPRQQGVRATALLFVGALLAACGTPGVPAQTLAPTPAATPTSAGSVAASPEAVTPSPTPQVQTSGFGSLGPVTLNYWHFETPPAGQKSISDRIKQFEQLYPNVTINITVKDFNDYLKIMPLTAVGSNPPDVIEGNQGWGLDDQLVKEGAILPLDKYAAAYGWTTRYDPAVAAQLMYTTDGKSWGSGSLFGVAPSGENVGILYNKANLSKLGLSTPPATVDELVADLDMAKAAGMLPIMLGESDKWPAIHVWGELQGLYTSPQEINDWVYGKAGTSFDTPANQQAAQMFQTWCQKGYFGKNFNSVNYNDSWAAFAKGQGLFYIGGDWLIQGVETTLGTNLGFELFPPGSNGKHAAIGSLSQPLHISSKTKYPDLVAALLDFMTNADSATGSLAAERVPVLLPSPIPASVTDPVLLESINALQTLNQEGGVILYEDFASPTMLDTLGSALQELMSSKITPTQFTKTVQADWAKFQASR
jgi:raffinose/stachyose/melibiose transport system substrate-binding protein